MNDNDNPFACPECNASPPGPHEARCSRGEGDLGQGVPLEEIAKLRQQLSASDRRTLEAEREVERLRKLVRTEREIADFERDRRYRSEARLTAVRALVGVEVDKPSDPPHS